MVGTTASLVNKLNGIKTYETGRADLPQNETTARNVNTPPTIVDRIAVRSGPRCATIRVHATGLHDERGRDSETAIIEETTESAAAD